VVPREIRACANEDRLRSTPNLDRIAKAGMRFDNCFCTNSICTPSRAAILTGQYSNKNGVYTLNDRLDPNRNHVAKELQRGGYQTAMIGKWHLASDPTGFDYWNILPGQGVYHDPTFIKLGERKQYTGYCTDLIADFTLDWLKQRDPKKPFFAMCHHKAPHRPWEPGPKYKDLFNGQCVDKCPAGQQRNPANGMCVPIPASVWINRSAARSRSAI